MQTPREAVKDAENIKLLSELQRQRMQLYDLNLVRFVPGEFAENLVSDKVHQHELVQYAYTCMCARKDCASVYLYTLTLHACIIIRALHTPVGILQLSVSPTVLVKLCVPLCCILSLC